MDPAQRKFVEVVYEALESAGIPIERLAGSKTGTFVGNFNYDHQLMQYRNAEYPQPYAVTGGGITILSNRVNYIFDLKGPSMTLDTACSSSMYALHMACENIYSGECDGAIVGGSNLILTPECQIFSSALGAVSPTSKCHTFDIEADGYARADGIGALYIKKLSKAIKDRDPIRAVIRATAVNSNGKTGGITHPSPDGQEAVIRRAYERAGELNPALTGYFECHGTGTAVGDPLEIEAVGRVFAKGRSPDAPLHIGSIKTNLGHSEPSSGIAGIMKAVLALEHGSIPPTIGLKTLNPNINLLGGRLRIVTESMPWPESLEVRRASVNSFGYGGANAHTILESVESILPGYTKGHQISIGRQVIKSRPLNGHLNGHSNGTNGGTNGYSGSTTVPTEAHFLLPLSSHDERTLRKNIENLSKFDLSNALRDLVYTFSCRRSLFMSRTFSTISAENVNENLRLIAEGPMYKAQALPPKIGFVFTGQGAQWPQMGLALLETFPRFLSCIRQLDAELDACDQFRNWTLEDTLRESPETSIVNEAECAQPLVTAVQIGLVELLQHWGVHPSAVTGHSSGEIAASFAAGLSTKREAIVTAYLRGKAVAENEATGLMLAVGIGVSEVQQYILPSQGAVTIACHNSPNSCTLSGDSAAIQAIKVVLDEKRIFCRELKTGGNAYHSHHMRALGSGYESSLYTALSETPPKVSNWKTSKSSMKRPVFFSSVHGEAFPRGILGPRYWRENLESPVLFSQAASSMIESMDLQTIVEIGPHSALQGPIRQIVESLPEAKKIDYLPSLIRNNDSGLNMLNLAGSLFVRGASIDLVAVNGFSDDKSPIGRTIVDLPHYDWQYGETPIFDENRWTKEWRLRKHPRHDILGSRIPGGVRSDPTWRNVLRIQDVPWLAHHCIGRDAVMPSAAYICMALEAATQVIEVSGHSFTDIKSLEVQNMTLSRALLLNDEESIETLFSVSSMVLNESEICQSRFSFKLVSVQDEEGTSSFVEHCRGSIEVGFDDLSKGSSELLSNFDSLSGLHKTLNLSQWYDRFAQIGLCYGPAFQGLVALAAGGTHNITGASIKAQPPVQLMKYESRYLIHPASLDAALQLSMVASHHNKVHQMKRAFMPTKIGSLTIRPQETFSETSTYNVVAQGTHKGVRGLSADLALRGTGLRSFLEAKDVFFIASDQHANIPDVGREPYTRIVWKPQFSTLTDEVLESLYPPLILSDDAVIPSLNVLALHQLIDFRLRNETTFQKGSKEAHLNRLLLWTEEKLTAARAQPESLAEKIFGASQEWRDKEITRRADTLNPSSSESRLMCHLYKNLEDIYSGKKTGIQVALQDNLLIDNYEHGQVYREGNRRLARVIDLFANERPGLKILEVGAGTGSATREILKALHGDTPWRTYSRYHFTDTTPSFLAGAETTFSNYGGMTYGTFDMEFNAQTQGYDADWDLVVASNVIHATADIKKTLQNVCSVLKPGGRMILLELTRPQLSAGLVLGTFSDFWKGDEDPHFPRRDGPFLSKDMWRAVLPMAGFNGLDFHLDDYAGDNRSATVLCATAAECEKRSTCEDHGELVESGATLIYRNSKPAVVDIVSRQFLARGMNVDILPVEGCISTGDIKYRRMVFLLEIEKPFFIDITNREWKGFQTAVMSAKSALWVSTGSLLDGVDPAFAMISGIVRGLKAEMSNLRFGTLDLDTPLSPLEQPSAELIHRYEQLVYESQPGDDVEFRRKGNVTYISRLVADPILNLESRALHEKHESTEEVSLSQLSSTPIRLDIETPGVLSTLYFREDEEFVVPLRDDEVEIKVIAAGLNSKDIAVVTGRHHSDSFSDECAGIIHKVGKNVTTLHPGDLVQCMSFSKFGNFVRDKAIFCNKINSLDSATEAATMPIAFGTAIYGLIELGRLQEGESVLIQSATGAVGLAAIQIARHCGAEIFVTVGTDAKKEALLNLGYGIDEDHILNSRSRQSIVDLESMTGGKGIDVILCSARGQLMHDYWRVIAPSGRFVEIGRTEILEGGQISLNIFRRNATSTSFDLEVLSKTKPTAIASLMQKITSLRAADIIKPLPHQLYHLSQIEQALHSFAKAVHIGKLVLTYDENDEMPVNYRHSPFKAHFDPDATYLLVGCLGGLGRSFSKWAVDRGARNLVYLSRSGAQSIEAKQFLESLRQRGVNVKVELGDVAKEADVEAVVRAAKRPIKGVVHGALTLNDGLFESMTLDQFNATIVARVAGVLNLHKTLLGQPLDFFQMWTSWTLMFGTATQSNYLASNAFMDAFARHRQSLGLAATSLSLSQVLGVGIVSYKPEYQQAMIRNGFYGNNEEEFLAYCEAGIEKSHPAHNILFQHDPHAASHLLVGIEPAGLANLNKKYPIREMGWASDPRFAQILNATDTLLTSSGGTDGTGGKQTDSEGGSVDEQICSKISRLLYVPVDEIARDRPIHVYGIDSMVAAELRNWLFSKFGKEISLLNLLSISMTVASLAETITSEGT